MLEYINYIIPEVEQPKRRLEFLERLKYTLVAIVLYFLLASTPIYGISKEVTSRFESLLVLLGASFGSLITLGIGPIVTGLIILELLIGAEVIRIDLTSDEGRRVFRYLSKWFALAFIILENSSWVLSGTLPPEHPTPWNYFIVISQLVLAGMLLIVLDDFVDKWGIGSGISLFIVCGVSRSLFSQLFSPIIRDGMPTGSFLRGILFLMKGDAYAATLSFIPFITFLLVFFLSVIAQGIKVEIPLALVRFRSDRSFKWPISLLYVSNIPVIFAAALLANINMWALNLYRAGYPILGEFKAVETARGVREVPVSGLVYYLTPEPVYDVFLGRVSFWIWLEKAIFYFIYMIIACVFFTKLWIMVAPAQSPESIAEMITSSYLQIPGFRANRRMIEKVIARYVNPVAILGGIFVGILAALADTLGAPVSGTSILLAVLILLNYYELILRQYSRELPEDLKRFLVGRA